MSKKRMNEFDKIKNVNLADLDENHNLKDSVDKENHNSDAAISTTAGTAVDEAGKDDTANQDKKENHPEGRYYEIDADITQTELRNFLLGHAYRQPLILLITLGAAILPCAYAFGGKNPLVAIFVACMVLIYYPFSMVLKAKRIKNQNTSFAEIFHYVLDEDEFHLTLSTESVDVEWKYFKKMMVLKSIVVVYTGKSNGYIIPTKDMGSRKDEILAFLKEKIGK